MLGFGGILQKERKKIRRLTIFHHEMIENSIRVSSSNDGKREIGILTKDLFHTFSHPFFIRVGKNQTDKIMIDITHKICFSHTVLDQLHKPIHIAEFTIIVAVKSKQSDRQRCLGAICMAFLSLYQLGLIKIVHVISLLKCNGFLSHSNSSHTRTPSKEEG